MLFQLQEFEGNDVFVHLISTCSQMKIYTTLIKTSSMYIQFILQIQNKINTIHTKLFTLKDKEQQSSPEKNYDT